MHLQDSQDYRQRRRVPPYPVVVRVLPVEESEGGDEFLAGDDGVQNELREGRDGPAGDACLLDSLSRLKILSANTVPAAPAARPVQKPGPLEDEEDDPAGPASKSFLRAPDPGHPPPKGPRVDGGLSAPGG
ncbi:hypothetical protein HDU85_007374 [Gaertneriomyces sp. JEL0708]|nr:hypothetical protein HDU85_007374 [Gaertneriomyces sp. JEL0708]